MGRNDYVTKGGNRDITALVSNKETEKKKRKEKLERERRNMNRATCKAKVGR
jgi:hypothetical protein